MPVLLTNTSLLENLFKMIGLLLVFIIIIIACYYVTRLVGTNQLAKTRNSNFKILDSYKLGQNQLIAIVEVGSRYFCVGITKEQVSLIAELDSDDFKMPEYKGAASFSNVFSSVLKKKNTDEAANTDNRGEEEKNDPE